MINILAATGGSRHAERAVRLSCQLARSNMAKLAALTVDDPGESIPLEHIRNITMSAAQETDAVITLEHASGQPDRVIREKALQGYDLLVIGARGLHSIQDFFLGRNAIRLVKNLPVSTLVVRRQDTVQRILWRIPQGRMEKKQIALICHFVKALKADLTLLVVQPRAFMFGHRQDFNLNEADSCGTDERLGALRLKINELTGVEAACRIRTGIPEEVILDEAAIGNYDLVAISVQPRRGLGKLFAEDLHYRVACNMPVSVLLLN